MVALKLLDPAPRCKSLMDERDNDKNCMKEVTITA